MGQIPASNMDVQGELWALRLCSLGQLPCGTRLRVPTRQSPMDQAAARRRTLQEPRGSHPKSKLQSVNTTALTYGSDFERTLTVTRTSGPPRKHGAAAYPATSSCVKAKAPMNAPGAGDSVKPLASHGPAGRRGASLGTTQLSCMHRARLGRIGCASHTKFSMRRTADFWGKEIAWFDVLNAMGFIALVTNVAMIAFVGRRLSRGDDCDCAKLNVLVEAFDDA